MIGMEELNKLLAIAAGTQRHQEVAAARNACRMHFPHVPMCVVNLAKTLNAVVFRLLCPVIEVLPCKPGLSNDTPRPRDYWPFTVSPQGNSAIGTAVVDALTNI